MERSRKGKRMRVLDENEDARKIGEEAESGIDWCGS
jgi:hypothetical protein